MIIEIPISVGELLDKISILSIKSQHTDNSYVNREKQHLTTIAKENKVYDQGFLNQLLEINSKLWAIEDELRSIEKSQDFNNHFIELARSVYITNDLRSSIKKEINEKYNSTYREIKVHK